MKKPPATKAGGTGISAGRWDLIAATRAAVAAALSHAGPVLLEVICHAKHQPQGGDPFLAAGDGIIIDLFKWNYKEVSSFRMAYYYDSLLFPYRH